jgi:hypothetical protein
MDQIVERQNAPAGHFVAKKTKCPNIKKNTTLLLNNIILKK